jgi:hypothetical protein
MARAGAELGYQPLERTEANLVFQVISKRYEKGSIILTADKAFSKAHMFRRTCARRRQSQRVQDGDSVLLTTAAAVSATRLSVRQSDSLVATSAPQSAQMRLGPSWP